MSTILSFFSTSFNLTYNSLDEEHKTYLAELALFLLANL